MTLFIIEGTDRSGKTTLTHAIRDTLMRRYPDDTVTLLHAGPPVKHPLDEYERPLFDYRPGTSRHVICDRWHIGECIYPEVMRRPTCLNHAGLSHIEAFLQSRGAVLIHVSAQVRTLRERFDAQDHDRAKSIVTWDQLLHSRQLFRRHVPLSRLPTIEIDMTDSTTNELRAFVEYAISQARDASIMTADLVELQTYVGPPRPRVVFFGDVRTKYRQMHTNVNVLMYAIDDLSPAFMPFDKSSGDYFLGIVDELMSYGDIGLMNANDVDDPYHAWKILREPIAVAMGTHAWKTMKSWAHGAVPHPQFIRRFYDDHTIWYYNLIRRVIHDGGDLSHERP